MNIMSNYARNGTPLPSEWIALDENGRSAWLHMLKNCIHSDAFNQMADQMKRRLLWHLRANEWITHEEYWRARKMYNLPRINLESMVHEAYRKSRPVRDESTPLYPRKGESGRRRLPKTYTQLSRDRADGLWLRSTGQYIRIREMNDGHLANTVALLKESHCCLIEDASVFLGEMVKQFGESQEVLDSMTKVYFAIHSMDVSDVYPVFDELVAEIERRKNGEDQTSWPATYAGRNFDEALADWLKTGYVR